MLDRDQNIANFISYIESVKKKHVSSLNAARQMQEQLETTSNQSKFYIGTLQKDEKGNATKVDIPSNCLFSTKTNDNLSAKFKVCESPNKLKPAPSALMATGTDPRTEYFDRVLELLRYSKTKK